MDKQILQEYLNKLNPEQRRAATLGNVSAVILAAAGSGKTTTLTTRIAYLHVEKEVPLQHMLAVTFTNKAAREMRERLAKQGLRSRDLWIGTFHGICNKILQTHATEAGLKRGFSIMDTQEQETFFKRMLRANGYDPKLVPVSHTLSQINGYKEVGWRSDKVPDNLQEKKLYALYEEACQTDNVVDFAELMLRCYELFQNNVDIAQMYAERFEHILVDEFQDTNELQYRWLKVLASHHNCIFAVGDDDQCVVKGTQVDTPSGQKRIENLKINDEVCTQVNTHVINKKIKNIFKSEKLQDIVEVKLKNGVTLETTIEHTWFVFLKGGRINDNSSDTLTIILCDSYNPTNNNLEHSCLHEGKTDMSIFLKCKNLTHPNAKHPTLPYTVMSNSLVNNNHVYSFTSKSGDYGALNTIYSQVKNSFINQNVPVNVEEKIRVDGSLLDFVLAKDLVAGMYVYVKDTGMVEIDYVKTSKKSVEVYDINVEDTHNFFANGILTHNSIYGFRGAKPENMNLLKNDFNAQVVKVEKNYRSEENILNLANKLIQTNNNRQGKNLVATIPAKNKILTYQALNNEEEASFLAGEIKRLRRTGLHYKDIAILYRTNSQSRAIEKSLTSYNIPYIVFGGFRFFDRQEVKHAMAYLRLAYDAKDNLAFLRVVNTPSRAIGDTTVRKLEILAQENKMSLFEAIDLLDVKTSKKFENFINLINHLKAQTKSKNLPEMVKTVIIDSGLENMYETDPKEGPERLDNLYELISAAEIYLMENPKSDITEFLAFSSLESDVNTKKRDENADVVKMMTVHSSKGLEFEAVFIVGLEQGLFPHANSLKDRDRGMVEEERRLMYVALTRAKHNLYLTFAEERRMNGILERYPRSQFWREFDPALLTRIK